MFLQKDSYCSLVAFLAVAVHVGVVGWIGATHFPSIDEMGHLPAGVSHWKFGNFALYRVNPPLVRVLAAAPVLWMDVDFNWARYDRSPLARSEFVIGEEFIENYQFQSMRVYVWARWSCIPLTVVGAWACWRLARRVYGAQSALLATLLWCFSPNVLANAAAITPDAGAAAIGIAAAVFLIGWLDECKWTNAFVAGIWLGLATLAKFTWLIFFLVCPVLWLLRRSVEGARRPSGAQLSAVITISVLVVNCGYLFEGTGARLGSYRFVSEALAGRSIEQRTREGRPWNFACNRFEDGVFAAIPVPFPRNFILGIDHIKYEFEKGAPSYLAGVWRHGGWYYYYTYAILLKVPLGVLVLGATSSIITLSGILRGRLSRRQVVDECSLLVIPLGILMVVSTETGFNHHLRYVLPAFPFFFVWISKLGRVFAVDERRNRWDTEETEHEATSIAPRIHPLEHFDGRSRSVAWRSWSSRGFVGGMVGWSILSSLSVVPHSHSYFNELADGPENGWNYLHNSNIDWGEDLSYLKRWLDDRPEIPRIGIASFHWVDVAKLGVNAFEPNRWPVPEKQRHLPDERVGPQPGWYAISVCHLVGEPDSSLGPRNAEAYSSDPSRSYFRHFDALDRIGYSMNIYHVTVEECNRVRRKLGLEELPEDWSRETRVESREPDN